MKRNWILGAFAVVVCVFAVLAVVAWHWRPRNGDTTHAPLLFHEPYNGIDFRYPATWRDVKGEHGIAAYKGARDCEIIVTGSADDHTPVVENLESLRKDYATDTPGAVFTQRPPWAGAQTPDASFAMTTGQGSEGKIEWENSFQHGNDQYTVGEIMRADDNACRGDLIAFEASFRFYPADPKAQ